MTELRGQRGPSQWAKNSAWRTELLFAAPIVALVLYLFYTWFAISDRYLIFLYFHDMGPGFDTAPFGWVTASRYWMSGLVAAGAVMVANTAANLVLGRAARGYRAPVWWRLWLLCAAPLGVAIPTIVMTVNDPVLPPVHAAQVTAALLAGLAVALAPGQRAAEAPTGCGLLLVDGLALALVLVALAAVGDLPRWLARGSTAAIYAFFGMLAAGAAGLLAMTMLYGWRRRTAVPGARHLLLAGLGVAYLFLPLCHHLFFCTDRGSWADPGYFAYIPDADNYFARDIVPQIAVWAAVALVALGVTRLRLWLRRRLER